MHKGTARFLDTLDRESRRHLDRQEANALRSEIEGHLDAAIAARMEMGATYEEAEREAVADFGNVRKFVRAMREGPKQPPFDKSLFAVTAKGWTLLYSFAYLGLYFYGDIVPFVRYASLYATAIMAGVIVAKSVRLRRIPFMTVLALYAFLVPVGAVGMAATHLPRVAGERTVTRHAVAGELRFIRDQGAGWQAILASYEAHRREFLQGSMIAPTLYETAAQGAAYSVAPDRAIATRRWAEAERLLKAKAVQKIALARSFERAYQDRIDRPWILTIPGWFGVSAAVMAVPPVVTLFFSALGIAFGWIRRRWTNGRRRIA
ncbi:MAG: permease prefix domain 1-containing protein [Fimbriimonas sp.]